MTDIDPDVQAARQSALDAAVTKAADAELDATIAQAVAASPDIPLGDDHAETAADAATEAADTATTIATAQGSDIEEARTRVNKQRKQALKDRVKEWKRLRAVHQDFLDNPDAYGGVDLGGAPIDPEQQKAMVAQYDIAIKAVKDEIASLGGTTA